jgi:uncharacterized peroxidase-related enzyme
MAHIPVQQGLPGITGLLEFRLDSAKPIRELTQVLLRGPSTLTEADRELIATYVSFLNECVFCTTAHAATASELLGNSDIVESVKWNLSKAPISEKLRVLLIIAGKVQRGGKNVTEEDIKAARALGATDTEIHDTVMIASLFCLYNRYVDGLASFTPTDSSFYTTLAKRLVERGYVRPEGGYTVYPPEH